MGDPVIFTPQSLVDLEAIVRYIAADNPERARRFGDSLVDAALAIGVFPEMGRKVPEAGSPLIREVMHGAFRLIYEIRGPGDEIFVLRFWHAARGIPELSDADSTLEEAKMPLYGYL